MIFNVSDFRVSFWCICSDCVFRTRQPPLRRRFRVLHAYQLSRHARSRSKVKATFHLLFWFIYFFNPAHLLSSVFTVPLRRITAVNAFSLIFVKRTQCVVGTFPAISTTAIFARPTHFFFFVCFRRPLIRRENGNKKIVWISFAFDEWWHTHNHTFFYFLSSAYTNSVCLFVCFADSIRGLTNEVRRSDCRRRSTSTTSWRTPSEPSTTKASSLPNSVRFFFKASLYHY